ncbi:hypothetical protein [Sphingomonas mesophila]|uniref:hypothetical protein n=1 Tax=Sphingomonas mesophila TaxID=2303576 RepID=UPI000E590237|nr:hypothetical protein [Sphingomonas mesophila]
MLSTITLAAMLVAVSGDSPATIPASPEAAAMTCRDMAMSSSRLDRVKVCKSKEEWRRWDLCHTSVPRQCSPKKATVGVAGLAPSEKLICKTFRETASRIGQRRFCATRREWELVALESRDAIQDRQSQSMYARTQTIFRNPSDGSGPQ